MLRPTIAVLTILSLACAGVDQPDYSQPAQPGYGQPGAPMQPVQPTNYGQPQTSPPPANAYTIMGPAGTGDGGLMWVDSDGRITGMYPDEGSLMFGMNDQLVWTRNAYGDWFLVQNGELVQLAGMPPELMSWPGVQTVLPGGYALPAPKPVPTYAGGGSGGYDPSYEIMRQTQQMDHETNMAIIENMGSEPVDYYDDGVYVGTW